MSSTNKPSTQPSAQAMIDFMQQDMIRRTDLMKRQFAEAASTNDTRELSKDLFIRNFLPYFCGEVPATPQLLRAWTSVAGSPYHEVRIVEAGKTIGVVPPLMNLNALKPVGRTRRGADADSLVNQAELVARGNPRGAQAKLANDLNARFNSARLAPEEGHRHAWEALLNIFGKSLVPKAPGESQGASMANDDDIYDYD